MSEIEEVKEAISMLQEKVETIEKENQQEKEPRKKDYNKALADHFNISEEAFTSTNGGKYGSFGKEAVKQICQELDLEVERGEQ